jgi:hypothetical protein
MLIQKLKNVAEKRKSRGYTSTPKFSNKYKARTYIITTQEVVPMEDNKKTIKVSELTKAIYISITKQILKDGLLTQREYDKAIASIMRL